MKIVDSLFEENYILNSKQKDQTSVICNVCGIYLPSKSNSIGAHFGYYHKKILEEVKSNNKQQFSMKCFECNELVANSQNVLGRHIRKQHEMEYEDYEIKWYYNGVRPKCYTCGVDLKRKKGGFSKFCSIKCGASGENNVMWGRKGKDSPNYGKTRTKEQRESYREAAHRRYKENPELIKQRREETIRRNETGDFGKKNSFVRKNPITNKQERFDSEWEYRFVLQNRDQYDDLTKTHSIRIPYISTEDYRKHIYIPDFVSEKQKEIIEIKGKFKTKTKDKLEAAKQWCKNYGYKYRVFTCGSGKELFEINNSGLLYGDTNPVSYGNKKMLVWRDKNLSYRQIQQMPIEEREEIAKEAFNFYRENGFPYPVYETKDLKNEWEKLLDTTIEYEVDNNNRKILSNKKTTGNKLIQHFNSKPFYSVSGIGNKDRSMIDAFNDDHVLFEVIKNRLGITYKECFNIHGAMIRQGFRSTRSCANVSTFNVLVAKYFYDHFVPKNGIVFDYSAGFGHRMLGALSSKNNLKCVGCDPWKEVCENNKKLASFLNEENRVEIKNIGSEHYIDSKHRNKIDFAFSSPPYFNKEVYDNNNKSQAYHDRNFDDFIQHWWKPTLNNIFDLLKDDGVLGINMVEPMIYHLLDIAFEKGWVEHDRYYLSMSLNHFNKNQGKYKMEPIVLLKKKQ